MVSDEVWKNNPAHVFKIDRLATNIQIAENVVLPTNVSKSLGQEISKCYNLKELNIQNKFSIAAEITDWLVVNTKITYLNFDFCNLSRETSEKLCQQIKHLSSLERCYLSGNVLGDAVSVLAESILSWGTNKSLDGLRLQNCSITSQGCSRLLEALGVCPNLIWLDLSDNTIGGAFNSLKSESIFPSSLNKLNLQNCSITSQGCSRLLEALGVCPNLKLLDLSDNTIGGAFNGLVSKSIFPELRFLFLNGTVLSAGDIKTIGSLIAEHRLPKLLMIYLSYVNLDNLELDTLQTLESLNYIIRNVEDVVFFKGDYLQDLNKIQESITG